MRRLLRAVADHIAQGAARDEQTARARRVGAQTARQAGTGAGLAAWARESTGATVNGRTRMPRTRCATCHTDQVQRGDGRPAAHQHDGRLCPGGGPA